MLALSEDDMVKLRDLNETLNELLARTSAGTSSTQGIGVSRVDLKARQAGCSQCEMGCTGCMGCSNTSKVSVAVVQTE